MKISGQFGKENNSLKNGVSEKTLCEYWKLFLCVFFILYELEALGDLWHRKLHV